MDLKPETLERIDKQIARYPDKRSMTLPMLHIIQEEKGHISKEAIAFIAEKLDLQPMQVFEVVTFYPMFRQEPIGKKHVKVCRTLSCALQGCYKTAEALQEQLSCGMHETSEDGNFTIEFVECLASCGTAPVVQVNETMHHNITPEKALELATELKQEVGAQ